MSIQLPDPQYIEVQFTPLDFGGLLTPALGGPSQRINRLGSRLAITYTLKPMRSSDEGMLYVSRLRRAKREGAIVAFPKPGKVVGQPDPLSVSGNWASGNAVNGAGFPPGYVIPEGTPLSIVHGGRRYIYWVAQCYPANGSGICGIYFEDNLRTPLSNGDAIELKKPFIEGWIAGDSDAWTKAAHDRNSIQFTVTEAV